MVNMRTIDLHYDFRAQDIEISVQSFRIMGPTLGTGELSKDTV